MSFSNIVDSYNVIELEKILDNISNRDVEIALSKERLNEHDLLALLSKPAKRYLEFIAEKSRRITLRRFGKVIKLYSPLYISNECVNSCVYCGFNRKNRIDRITLNMDEIIRDASIISSLGIKNIVVVSGDNFAKCSDDFLIYVVKEIRKIVPLVSVEVRALEEDVYAKLYQAGADGFTMFQETYLKHRYNEFHPSGPKSDYNYRLDTPERAASAGIRYVGLGALLGLTDFRIETFLLNQHTRYLIKKFPHANISSSFPRMRSSAGCYVPENPLTDSDLYQSIFAYRLYNHDAGINISTRESIGFRDKIIHLGATIISAGSKTEPGGYSKDNSNAEQFRIDDDRSVDDIVHMISSSGYDAVFKDSQETCYGKISC